MIAVLGTAYTARDITAIAVNTTKDRITKDTLAFKASIAPLHRIR